MTQRRVLNADNRGVEVEKYLHPLEEHRPHLNNPVAGPISPNEVNVADSIVLGELMMSKYIASLPGGFHNPIRSPIKTTDVLKKHPKDKPFIDLENIFLRLLMIGQMMELLPLFNQELFSVLLRSSMSIFVSSGCHRKANKSGLVKRLVVIDMSPTAAGVVVADVVQLFFLIICPYGGSPSDPIASILGHLSHYPDGTEKSTVFDKYQDVSAERIRRVVNVSLCMSSPPASVLIYVG